MKLTDKFIKNLKSPDKTKRYFDGYYGLYLEHANRGGKYWRQKYRYLGKEKRLSHGVYPIVTLKVARDRCLEAKRLLDNGIDPADHKKEIRETKLESASNSFVDVARDWHKKQSTVWTARHSDDVWKRIERHLLLDLGSKSISEIKPREILTVVSKLDDQGKYETAHRLLGVCSQIMRFAVASGKIVSDPTRDLRGALSPLKRTHRSAITEPSKVGPFLNVLDGYDGSPIVRSALLLAPLLFVRPGELRTAKWIDIDFDRGEWRFHISKTESDHIVPLAKQAIHIFKQIEPITKDSPYVFPNGRTNSMPMSDNALNAALRRMGVAKSEMCAHGFRAMARTILEEELGFSAHIIEQQLAHVVRDPLGRAYNRTTHIKERTKMMQEWADYLDELKVNHNR